MLIIDVISQCWSKRICLSFLTMVLATTIGGCSTSVDSLLEKIPLGRDVRSVISAKIGNSYPPKLVSITLNTLHNVAVVDVRTVEGKRLTSKQYRLDLEGCRSREALVRIEGELLYDLNSEDAIEVFADLVELVRRAAMAQQEPASPWEDSPATDYLLITGERPVVIINNGHRLWADLKAQAHVWREAQQLGEEIHDGDLGLWLLDATMLESIQSLVFDAVEDFDLVAQIAWQATRDNGRAAE